MTTQLTLHDALQKHLQYAFSISHKYIQTETNRNPGGYCLFMAEKHNEMKDEEPDMSKRSKIIAELWKDADTKKIYNEKAKNYVKDKKKTEKKLNRFQIFCEKTRVDFKNNDKKSPNMTKLGNMWKELSEEEKTQYIQKQNSI